MMKGLVLFSLLYVVLSVEPISQGTCASHDGTIKLTTTTFKNATVDDWRLVYVNRQVVYLKTDPPGTRKGTQSSIYRSEDGGKTWDLQTRQGGFPSYAGEGIRDIFTSQASSTTLYFLGTNGRLWTTVDGGKLYVARVIPTEINSLVPNNLESNYVIGRATSAYYISTDYGASWNKMLDMNRLSRTTVSWSIFPTESHKRIYAKVLPSQRDPKARQDYDSVLLYSDDFFQTSTQISVKNIHYWSMYTPDKIAIVACTDVTACTTKTLHISEDGGKTFNPVVFPNFEHETQDETSIRTVEVSDDVIWTFVRRYCKSSTSSYCYGDLFHSYAADREFTHSLSEVRSVGRDRLDFTKYNSLDGIYLVNQYFDIEEEDATDVRTLITFNKGSTWNILQAPKKDANGQPTNCDIVEGCSLHLHGWTDAGGGFDGFYSPPNAIGVMVASGNVGNELMDRKDEVNFYYSRNGGIDWKEVRNGRYVPEIGNHGTAVVAAKIGDPTNVLIYSLDEGDTWLECAFHQTPIDVRNVRVTPGWDSTQFILYGHKDGDAYIIHHDFSDAYKGKCGQGDFEVWSPTDEHGDCFMGHRIEYTRRAVGKTCFLDEEHIHESKAVNCPCNAWDYECAECYFRPTLSAPCQFKCVTSTTIIPPPPPTPTFCDKSTADQPIYYTAPEPEGYILVPEDTCDGKLPGSHAPPKALVNCEEWKALTQPNTPPGPTPPGPTPPGPTPTGPPTPEPPQDRRAGYAIGAVVVIALLCAGFIYLWRTNESFKAKVSATLGWKSEERDISYQQISTTVVSSDEELSGGGDAPKIADQLESSETSS